MESIVNLKNKEGFTSVIVFSILLIVLSSYQPYFKEFFVSPMGNVGSGLIVSILLSVGLIMKWKYFKTIIEILIGASILFTIYVVFNTYGNFQIAWIVNLIFKIALVSYLVFSKKIKSYVYK